MAASAAIASPCCMSDLTAKFGDPEKVSKYTKQGPPAFAPGHAGMLQMAAILIAEVAPSGGNILVVGAGGGLEIAILPVSRQAGASSVSIRPPPCSISRPLLTRLQRVTA